MFCNKCGNVIEEGKKFCTRCGSPVNANIAPVRGAFNSPVNTDNQKTWCGIAIVLVVLSILTLLCIGFSMSVREDMISMKISMPFTACISLTNSLKPLIMSELPSYLYNGNYVQSVSIWCTVWAVFYVIIVLLSLFSIIYIIKKKSAGIIAGILSSALSVIFSIIMIIIIFYLNTNMQYEFRQSMNMSSQAMISVYPSIWTWFALIIAIVNGLFLVIKSKDLIS